MATCPENAEWVYFDSGCSIGRLRYASLADC